MRKDARLNLDRILAAAKDCFAEFGAAVTMEEVAARAGVGVGTLYRRFPSRAALVETLYDDAVRHASEQAAALATEADPWDALTRWCGAYVDLLATKATLLAELSPLRDQRPEMVEAQRRRARATFAAFLARAEAAGAVRSGVDAADVVALLNATMSAGRPNAAMLAIVLAGIRAEGR